MSSNDDGVDQKTLDQFLRELDLPIPQSEAAPSFQAPEAPLDTSQDAQPPKEAPTSLVCGSSLVLEEEDKEAILAALDAYHEHGEPSTVPEGSEQGEDNARKLARQRAKAVQRRNRHRQRVKAEWQRLREQSAQFTAQLEKLKRCRAPGRSHAAPFKWQALASKELAARVIAEVQQQRVRSAIEQRAAAINMLQQVLDISDTSRAQASSDRGQYEWNPDDFKLYTNFIFEVSAAYARTDEVLRDCGLGGAIPSSTSFYKPARKRDTLRNVDFFESTSAFVFPSKYPESANALFSSMRQVHRQNPQRRLLETVADLPNTIAVKFGTNFHYDVGKMLPLELILVMHRFAEPGRTVLVWRSLIEGDGDFAGTFFDSIGWCVLRPSAGGGVDSTDVRTCIHLMPTQFRLQKELEGDESVANIEEFTEAVMHSSQQDKLELARLMQGLLLEQQ